VPALTTLLSDWVWEQDEQFRFTFLSEGLARKTGLDAAAWLGRTRWELLANLGDAEWARHRAQLERHEPFRDFETRRVNFTFRWVPDEHVRAFASLSARARNDVRRYVRELAAGSPFFARQLAAEPAAKE